jgi:hypothetical protein
MKKPTCKTCKFWDFKVSTDKAWGRCLNKDVQNSTYISLHIPGSSYLTKEKIYELMKYVRKHAKTYFEENTFGCIYHEPGVDWLT